MSAPPSAPFARAAPGRNVDPRKQAVEGVYESTTFQMLVERDRDLAQNQTDYSI